jgi:hypothetical protein
MNVSFREIKEAAEAANRLFPKCTHWIESDKA